jgi:glycosyltransferase involved in cell wall biosynthesis
MKRVFVDAHVFDEGFQGSRTFLKGLYSEILKKNLAYEFYFGVDDVDNFKREFSEHTNLKIIKYRFKNRYFRLLIDLPYILVRNKIDIGHFQYISPFLKVSIEIVTTHDVLFLDFPALFPSRYRFLRTLLFRTSARRADLLTTDSEYSRNSIAMHFQIPKDKIVNTLCGVSQEFYSKSKLDTLPDIKTKYGLSRFLLFVGRVEPRKNHLMVVQSYCKLKLWEKGYSLVFVGKYDLDYPELDRYLAGLSAEIKEHIHFMATSQEELYSFYKQCDLFVYPSLAEGFGLPPLEAALAGATVLCSNRTSMSHYSFFGDKLFSPDDGDAFSAKIVQFISREKDSKRIKQEIEHISNTYNWGKIAENFIAQIDQLATKK